MKPSLEPRKALKRGTSFVVFLRKDSAFGFHWHYHVECELTYIIQSRGMRLVGDNVSEYRSGDLVFLGSNVPHTWSSEGKPGSSLKEHRAIVVQFSPLLLSDQLLRAPEFERIRKLFAEANRGLHYQGAIVPQVAQRMQRLLTLKGVPAVLELISILDSLSQWRQANQLSSPKYSPKLKLHIQNRFERILLYLEKHYDAGLDLKNVAAVAHMSPSAFSRFFRRMARKPFIRYLNELRIAEACKRLIEGDQAIIEIAFAVGFNNLSNFNRRFLMIKHMTPRAYRQRYNPPS